MSLIITYVVMNFFYNSRTLKIGWVELGVNFVGDMHQNGNLEIIPMHVLDLVMSFECIIIQKSMHKRMVLLGILFKSYLNSHSKTTINLSM